MTAQTTLQLGAETSTVLCDKGINEVSEDKVMPPATKRASREQVS